jgi:hypothetical protein
VRRKQSYLIWTATGALLGLAGANAPAQTAVLSIHASNGDWTAYAALDSGTDNIGLADFCIDVVGTDGVNVTGSYFVAPLQEPPRIIPFPPQTLGFIGFNGEGGNSGESGSSGAVPGNGIAITGGQNILYGTEHSAAMDLDIIQGFGKTAGSQDGVTWGFPAEIADGTYSGNSGFLTVTPDLSTGAGLQSLDVVSGGRWVGPGNISTDTTFSGSVAIVPEPSALIFPLLAGILLTRAGRKI